MLSYMCTVRPRYIPIKCQFVKSLYSSRRTLLCCSRALPDHFPWCQCWILHPSLVSVSQYQLLLIVMPAESQSISSIPCQSKKIVTIYLDSGAIWKFLGLWTSNVFPLRWPFIYWVCDNATKLCDSLMPYFHRNHRVHLWIIAIHLATVVHALRPLDSVLTQKFFTGMHD
jgi:hypothetical protein